MLFKPAFFEAALGVNLTTMLVLTTININVRQILPTTSYLKLFDIWLLICQLVPFIEVGIPKVTPKLFLNQLKVSPPRLSFLPQKNTTEKITMVRK